MSERPVRWDVVSTALGPFAFAVTSAGLARLRLGDADATALHAWSARCEPGARLVRDPRGLRSIAEELEAYATGKRRAFDLPLDLRGSAFERAAWDAMRAIPFGRTRTYGELARALGQPGAARAVGRAAGSNPVPIVVPCHRVWAADGLGGFSAGLSWKRALLRHEGHALQLEMW